MERDGSALAKLGGGMTDTALVILMVGIAAFHLRMHHRERNDDVDNCYDDNDDDNDDNKGEGSPWTVLADAATAAADLILARRAWVAVAAARDDDDNDQLTTANEAILPSRPE